MLRGGRRRLRRWHRRWSAEGHGPRAPARESRRSQSPAQANASSSQRVPSAAVPVSQCDQLEPPAITQRCLGVVVAIAHSSAARRLSCSWVIASQPRALGRARERRLAAPRTAAAKCAAIASRTRLASPRSLSFSWPYCAQRLQLREADGVADARARRRVTCRRGPGRGRRCRRRRSCRRRRRLRRSRGRIRRGRPRAARRRVARRRTTGRSSSRRRLRASAGAGARCAILR